MKKATKKEIQVAEQKYYDALQQYGPNNMVTQRCEIELHEIRDRRRNEQA